jgi:hypothetical protein
MRDLRDRSAQILRLLCLVLVALLLLELVRAVFNARPLAGVVIPAIPRLETNAPAAASTVLPGAMKPLPPAAAPKIQTTGTVQVATISATNPAGTNIGRPLAPASPAAARLSATNVILTNLTGRAGSSNPAALINPASPTNLTNVAMGHPAMPGARHSHHGPGGMNFGLPMMGGMPGGPPKLAPDAQARVDQIVNSEIFAPVMHPLPMGLLGIAGDDAFLRTDSGQTGLVKPGDSLGDVKLLRIGINRVLVEQGGQKKELTIFDGYGGESLLPSQDHTSK